MMKIFKCHLKIYENTLFSKYLGDMQAKKIDNYW